MVFRPQLSVGLALAKIKSKSLVIGINSDILYPKEEQLYLNEHIPDCKLVFMDSEYGHDGFLIETEKINQIGLEFLNNY